MYNCPNIQCNKPLTKLTNSASADQCLDCKIFYYKKTQVIHKKMTETIYILWFLKDNNCMLLDCKPHPDLNYTDQDFFYEEIPWVAYDITIDDLKLYMTFS